VPVQSPRAGAIPACRCNPRVPAQIRACQRKSGRASANSDVPAQLRACQRKSGRASATPGMPAPNPGVPAANPDVPAANPSVPAQNRYQLRGCHRRTRRKPFETIRQPSATGISASSGAANGFSTHSTAALRSGTSRSGHECCCYAPSDSAPIQRARLGRISAGAIIPACRRNPPSARRHVDTIFPRFRILLR
jgi:hypothetical protein